ncbi:CDP-diacylglycerol--serine O-phosphatidyltransferase [Rhodovulum sp. P5]|uniref:CDP-diacylglycerol--serine O-phosphatidyltransferase n=1 Tax=Rhodovulum sp. P5 TaxID=1564506 RepID=UPI0009C2E0BD|nr:CDP-diacylglycerol--serine O-phosphatidyltransferase [Rhodovulum sp. P5]ARE41132.1 CDP-diacylglycerol--serine O-phosphatidyltransferase [Rhodovulum sp. P5]
MPETNPKTGPRGEQSPVSLLLLLPNMVTLMGMCFGLTSIRFAIEERYAVAVFLILLAALADGLDGLLARKLGAESPMGAQLDSLSDFLCFGVAPALLVYQVHLTQAGGLGWIFALIFAAATCLRLARFNVMSGQADDSTGPKRYFVGVPAPAGAFLGLLPVFLSHAGAFTPGYAPLAVSVWLAIVAVLMISKLKTPSPKAVKVPRRLIAVIFFATVIAIGVSFSRPWMLLVAIDGAYLAAVVYAIVRARGRLFG